MAHSLRNEPENCAADPSESDEAPHDAHAARRQRVEIQRTRGAPISCGEGTRRARTRSSTASKR